MDDLKLIQPSEEFAIRYLERIGSEAKKGLHPKNDYAFTNLSDQLRRWQTIRNQIDGFSQYWMVDELNVLGSFQIRHTLFHELEHHVGWHIFEKNRIPPADLMRLGLTEAASLWARFSGEIKKNPLDSI